MAQNRVPGPSRVRRAVTMYGGSPISGPHRVKKASTCREWPGTGHLSPPMGGAATKETEYTQMHK